MKLSLLLLLALGFGWRPLPGAWCRMEVAVESEPEEGHEEQGDGKSQQQQQQQGSWSQWWSYDGISGPDYWNINKRWRLCEAGRRQSPVEVRTERLVYDHLLGPIRLTWLAHGHQFAWPSRAEEAASNKDEQQPPPNEEQRATVKAQLLNSGRGLELWLEEPATSLRQPNHHHHHKDHSDQLILWAGPLSYHYKLYKLELHSAPSQASLENPSQTGRPSSEHLIDGRSFDGELQLHFYNRHLAGSAHEAQRMAEGHAPLGAHSLYAVVSVFLLVAPSSSLNSSASQLKEDEGPLDFWLDRLQELESEGKRVPVELRRSQLERLVPNRRHYIHYQGSLNRPPCSELVDWLLVNQALRIKANKFQRLFDGPTQTSQENIRPVKPLHNRLLRTTIGLGKTVGKTAASPQDSTGRECRQMPEGASGAASAKNESKVSQWLRQLGRNGPPPSEQQFNYNLS